MNLIPIRDRLGTIIGLQSKEEVDAVQATIDAAMQTLGASPQSPAQPQARTRPALRFELAVVLLVIFVVTVWLSIGQKQLPPTKLLLTTAVVTISPSPSPTLTATVSTTPSYEPTEQPTSEPPAHPTEAAFSPPPAPQAGPALEFCVQRSLDL